MLKNRAIPANQLLLWPQNQALTSDMRKTSFGEMEILFMQENKPQVEYLKFVSNGRSHRHPEFESFFTLKGSGKVIVGDQVHRVGPGDLVTIPPDLPHWMEPDSGVVMEGLLWYHESPLNQVK
jgi:mannose-6-phosphate isomerase-like protein (cupin superfamily)